MPIKFNPIVYVCASKHEMDMIFDFKKDDVSYTWDFPCFLPNLTVANQVIKDFLNDDFVALEVTIISFHNGTLSIEFENPIEWMNEDDAIATEDDFEGAID